MVTIFGKTPEQKRAGATATPRNKRAMAKNTNTHKETASDDGCWEDIDLNRGRLAVSGWRVRHRDNVLANLANKDIGQNGIIKANEAARFELCPLGAMWP